MVPLLYVFCAHLFYAILLLYLAVVVENAEEASAVVFVEVIRLGHVVELDDHLIAHAGFMKGLGIFQRFFVRGHRTPPR